MYCWTSWRQACSKPFTIINPNKVLGAEPNKWFVTAHSSSAGKPQPTRVITTDTTLLLAFPILKLVNCRHVCAGQPQLQDPLDPQRASVTGPTRSTEYTEAAAQHSSHVFHACLSAELLILQPSRQKSENFYFTFIIFHESNLVTID